MSDGGVCWWEIEFCDVGCCGRMHVVGGCLTDKNDGIGVRLERCGGCAAAV